MIKHVGSGLQDCSEGPRITKKIRGEDLYLHTGHPFPYSLDRLCKLARAPFREVVPCHRRNDYIPESQLRGRRGDILRLLVIHSLGAERVDSTKTTISRAISSQDHEGCSRLSKALTPVGTPCLF